MEQKTNIAELLKDAPKGTKLYSPVCGECELLKVNNDDGFIEVQDVDNETLEFFNDGRYYREGECLLFPSKEVRDWGCFKAKYARGGEDAEALLKSNGGFNVFAYCLENEARVYYIDTLTNNIKCAKGEVYDYILSTGTELILEEKPHKFKVGDVIGKYKPMIVAEELNIPDEYWITPEDANRPLYDYSYTPPEEIVKWNKEVLEPNHLHYSTSKRKIIHWFLPFDKVVVREAERKWHADLFSEYDIDNDNDCEMCYLTLGGSPWDECLPYNAKTAKLIGTTDDYEEYD